MATTEIYTLSLHDALPIYTPAAGMPAAVEAPAPAKAAGGAGQLEVKSPMVGTYYGAPEPGAKPDRKSTRLNSSHSQISYAVFCLKKKKTKKKTTHTRKGYR